jgi:mRNA interferase HigB
VRVIAKRTLREFWAKHPDAQGSLAAWYRDAEAATWREPADIKARVASVSFVGSDRVVFNIGGNKYRLVARVVYAFGLVYVRFVGTHAAYDAIDVATI